MSDYNTAENHAAFCAAMAAAQGEIENVGKTSTNPHFKSKYAGLDAIRSATSKILAKHGLWISSRLITNSDSLEIATTIGHASGYREEPSVFAIPLPAAITAQTLGSAATYGRRYLLSALFNLASEDEDDDGNAASAGNGRRTAPGPTGPVTPAQAEELRAAIVEVNAELSRFLKAFSIERLEQMPAGRFAEAMRMLEMKRIQAENNQIIKMQRAIDTGEDVE